MAIGLGTAMAIGAGVKGVAGGITGRKGAKEAKKKQEKAMKAQLFALKKGLDTITALKPAIDKFAKTGQDGYDKYNRMLGQAEEPIEKYYSELNPDDYAAQGNQFAQQESQKATNEWNQQMAQNGIMTSGVAAQQQGINQSNLAQTKAQNRFNAPKEVVNEQQKWLQYVSGQENNNYNRMEKGLNQQTGLADKQNLAYQNMANVIGGQGSSYGQQGQQSANRGQQAMNSGMRGVGFFGDRAGWFDGGGSDGSGGAKAYDSLMGQLS